MSITRLVKKYVGLCVFVVFLIEVALGTLVLKSTGHIQLAGAYGMLFTIVMLVSIVTERSDTHRSDEK